jgi:3-methyladenine DNA glycosylase AlkD
MDILKELKSLAEESYKEFNRKIIPTKQTTLGVRLPVLRRLAKQIVKQDPMAFVRRDKQNVYEMIMLEGMVLSYLERPFMELLPHIERFLDKVDNWAQVDSTICDFKSIRKEKEAVFSVVQQWLASDNEFVVRAALVVLLAHYVERNNLKTIFELSQSVAHSGYYVLMGNAWLISVCMAKYPEETLRFFKNNTLDARTHNKAIQKCRESFRVSKENKAILVELKKKVE